MSGAMVDKTCVVTGATQGIGLETAVDLARQGASVVIVGRNVARTAAAVAQIRQRSNNQKIASYIADLSSFKEVRALAAKIKSSHRIVDVLVNNAGAMTSDRRESPDGFELMWGLNHLSYFLLTAELLPSIMAADAGRIVNVASIAHGRGKIDFDDLQGLQKYSMWKAYSQSKLANIMFTYALARRLEGSGVTVNCLHPGLVASGFVANIGPLEKFLSPVIKWFMISAKEGAKTSIYLASAPGVASVSGKYFIKSLPVASSDRSRDAVMQAKLWDLSAEQTGAKYQF